MNEVLDHFLLSHHSPAERHRCLVIPFPPAKYYVCARCFGAICGAVLALPIVWVNPFLLSPWLILLAFPDWVAGVIVGRSGSNGIRLVSGGFIGISYALNLRELLHLHFRPDVWAANGVALMIYLTAVCLAFRLRGSKRTHFIPETSRDANSNNGPR